MPYVCVNLSKKIDSGKELELKSAIARAIEIIPGKSEQVLMVDIVDGKTMYFGGERQENCAYVDVKVYGKVDFAVKSEFTRKMFQEFGTLLGVAENRMFLSVSEYETWGSKGNLK